MKYLYVFVAVLLCLCFISPLLPDANTEKIYTDTIRLHILADSDSQEDQNIKLLVRDNVLSYISSLVLGLTEKRDAENTIRNCLSEIKMQVSDFLYQNGNDIPVSVSLGAEYYPTRDYGGYSLPAGKYTSLIIRLGSAEGKNWWCVLFPQICVGAAKEKSASSQALVHAGFSSEQINIITDNSAPKYKLKFKILEILGISYP